MTMKEKQPKSYPDSQSISVCRTTQLTVLLDLVMVAGSGNRWGYLKSDMAGCKGCSGLA